MCGRFTLTLDADRLAEMFSATAGELPPVPRHNICPTQDIAVVLSTEAEGRVIVPRRWGFLPKWAKAPDDGPLLINARAETVAEKPAFREAVRQRRCLVPASGFYEWTTAADGGKDPYYIYPARGAALAFAGIWQDWSDGQRTLSTAAILTTQANAALAHIHHRMPVIISPEDFTLWLGEAGPGAARLMQPADNDLLAFHGVDRRVNAARSDDPGLIAPLSAG